MPYKSEAVKMQEEEPLLAVMVAAYFKRCLGSFFRNRYRNFKVVFVVNCGCALLYRKSVIGKIGGFNSFFWADRRKYYERHADYGLTPRKSDKGEYVCLKLW